MTKYRRGVLRAQRFDLLAEVFAKVCSDFRAVLVDDDDHVHLIVEYPPTVPVSRLVNCSSRRLQQQYSIRTHRRHLWFPASREGAPLAIIRQ